ncbi:MAG: septal ring lytic transglycosylase RlpA family protein [Calditrichaceae bacterium]
MQIKNVSNIFIYFFVFLFYLTGCSSDRRFSRGDTFQRDTYTQYQSITGVSSYYGKKFHGKLTANGEVFDMYKLTAAHKSLPFDTLLEVENLSNGKRVVVRINDRGPFVKNRILDLSYAAAKEIDMIPDGTAKVKAKIIRLGVSD